MTLGAAIRTHALSDATIAAAIGTRWFPINGEQPLDKDTPVADQVVYSQDSEATVDSISAGHELLLETVISMDSVADPRGDVTAAVAAYDRAETLSLAILDRFHGFGESSGLMGGGGGVQVVSVEQIDRQDVADLSSGLIGKTQTFKFIWRR